MANKIVSNTGPIIHLNEINFLEVLDIFSSVFIPEEVANELKKNNVLILRKIKIIKLTSESKDKVKIITNEYNLDLGEAEAITLALQEKIDYFITDDLEARKIAKKYFIEVHGTIGVVLRALKEKLIDKKTAIEKVNELKTKSSLFITQDLINEITKAISEF